MNSKYSQLDQWQINNRKSWQAMDAWKYIVKLQEKYNAKSILIDYTWHFYINGILVSTKPFQKHVPICLQKCNLFFDHLIYRTSQAKEWIQIANNSK